MTNQGPVALWETQDGYLKYRLHLNDEGFFLVKQDLNARVSTTAHPVKAFSFDSAVKYAESKIKRSKKQLARVY